jgi:glycosyltransferase involved in cell wall biosynthesis
MAANDRAQRSIGFAEAIAVGIAEPNDVDGPKISVVTACYNSLRFIDRLYQSLQAQTYDRFEWICVDDGSSDATVEHLLKLRAPGALGMQVYRLPHNSGSSIAIAFGVQRARGDLVIIMDHDDEFMPHGLAAVRDAWPSVKDDPTLCGLAFQAAHPDGKMIGRPIPVGSRFSHSWMMNVHPDAHDATFAIKTPDAKAAHDPQALEPICTWGVVMNDLTATKRFVAGAGSPIRYYHRDNPNSQMNNWKLSRKWVSSYARYLDQADVYYLRRPLKWIRHAVALARYSRLVHGSYLAAAKEIRRASMRQSLMVAAIPAYVLDRLSSKRPIPVDVPLYPVDELGELKDLRQS